MSSRGMGAINPSKMPSGKHKARRDKTACMVTGVMKPRRDDTSFLDFNVPLETKGSK
tara:strand:+ start:1092 stop:1262 length:171 start_codon:yes stop_codon:yes gene_type:complete